MTDAVLLDIEGTTTSISFVFDVLFPYAATRIPDFLAQHGHRAEVVQACGAIARDALPAETHLVGHDLVLTVVRRQMAGDIKAGGLKTLQGLVWQHGYESGDIKAHVFADVPVALKQWHGRGRVAAIYSSGSRLAQQLLFRHSLAGDLTPFLAGFYDTGVGPKREAASYLAIAQQWGRPPESITFCTDIPAEAAAAEAAGCRAIVLMRPGNPPLPANLPFAVHADLLKV